MWNKLAKIFQDLSYRRLGIALLVSALLHTFLLDGFSLSLPTFNDDARPLEARIVLNTAKPAPLNKPAPPDKPKQAPASVKQKQVKPSKPIESPKEIKPAEQSAEKSAITEPAQTEQINDKVTENSNEQVATPQLAESPPPPEVDADQPQQAEPHFVTHENAYQYVETDFDVRTEANGSVQGFAKIVYEVVEGNFYSLSFVVKPKGLAALFVSNLVQTSKGRLTSDGLQPSTYDYQYGDKSEKARTANFDWINNKLELITAKDTKIEELPVGTQDLLSFMYQFIYAPPLQNMQINIANGKKRTLYTYGFEGEEMLFLPSGKFRTIHIAHTGDDTDEKTELWLAIDYQHIPVKIVKTEKQGRYYEFVATRINTTRVTPQ